jgi:DNA invertase Pin-like site-specific DNA recombinase
MKTDKYIAYYRVSTKRQGKSGLGLDAQQNSVREYLNGGKWKLIEEVIEVESGKRKDRPELLRAIQLCKVHNATLLIAKLDRLARNVAFVSALMESGVEFVSLMPIGLLRLLNAENDWRPSLPTSKRPAPPHYARLQQN